MQRVSPVNCLRAVAFRLLIAIVILLSSNTSRTFSTHREKGKFFDDAMRNPG